MIELEMKAKKEDREIHIAVDFDGVLADHDYAIHGWTVGKPVPKMIKQVKKWLDKGYKISIFTARLSHSRERSEVQIPLIQNFLKENGLPDNLPITCVKSYWFTHFIDDRAYHCVPNTGDIDDRINI